MKNNNLKKTLMENVFLFIFIFFLLFLLIFLLKLLVDNNSMFNNLKPIENKNLLNNINKNEQSLINDQLEEKKEEKLFNAKMEDIVLNKNDKFFFKKELISILEQELNDKESLIKDLYFTKYLIKQN